MTPIARRYVYRLQVTSVAQPLSRSFAWQIKPHVDVPAMRQAASKLVGTRDFSTFGSPPQGDNSVRTVRIARWTMSSDNDLRFTIEANAFLFRMVRSIVGTFVRVGQGRMSVEEFEDVLEACDRGRSAAAAPARGLSLENVIYKDT